jgi:hypothetical protein
VPAGDLSVSLGIAAVAAGGRGRDDARLHRQNRYDRATDTVEAITGTPPQTVAEFVAGHADIFS